MKKLSQNHLLVVLVTIAVTIIVGIVVMVAVVRRERNSPAIPETTHTNTPQPVHETEQPRSQGFGAKRFYDQVKDGMSLAQLNELAGKAGDCASSGVHPQPRTMPCYWSDTQHTVRVMIGSEGVISKFLNDNK